MSFIVSDVFHWSPGEQMESIATAAIDWLPNPAHTYSSPSLRFLIIIILHNRFLAILGRAIKLFRAFDILIRHTLTADSIFRARCDTGSRSVRFFPEMLSDFVPRSPGFSQTRRPSSALLCDIWLVRDLSSVFHWQLQGRQFQGR